jgi:hypothetical protein
MTISVLQDVFNEATKDGEVRDALRRAPVDFARLRGFVKDVSDWDTEDPLQSGSTVIVCSALQKS